MALQTCLLLAVIMVLLNMFVIRLQMCRTMGSLFSTVSGPFGKCAELQCVGTTVTNPTALATQLQKQKAKGEN